MIADELKVSLSYMMASRPTKSTMRLTPNSKQTSNNNKKHTLKGTVRKYNCAAVDL